MFGPLSFMLIGFGSDAPKPFLRDELMKLREKGLIRIVDLKIIKKSEDGDITAIEATDLSDDEKIELGAAVGALIGLGAGGEEGAEAGAMLGAYAASEDGDDFNDEEITDLAESIPEGTAAALLLVEHVWAKDFRDALRAEGGLVLASGWVSAEKLIGLGVDLAALAEYIDEKGIPEFEE